MTNDPASLENLADIVLPPPVSIWPLATGGMLILAGLVFILILLGLQYYAHYRKNRYRRAGLALLADAATVRDVSVTLKRVALAAFPREEVASLYGREWIDFLNETDTGKSFGPGCFEHPLQPPDFPLLKSAQKWITAHRGVYTVKRSG